MMLIVLAIGLLFILGNFSPPEKRWTPEDSYKFQLETTKDIELYYQIDEQIRLRQEKGYHDNQAQ